MRADTPSLIFVKSRLQLHEQKLQNYFGDA
jgi:hypothetical protein